MRHPIVIAIALALTGCSTDDAVGTLLPLAPKDTPEGASQDQDELVPYIEEILFEMRDDYSTAVMLHEDIRFAERYAHEYGLMGSYIEYLMTTIASMEELLTFARGRSLTEIERSKYKETRSEWQAKSTVVFKALLKAGY